MKIKALIILISIVAVSFIAVFALGRRGESVRGVRLLFPNGWVRSGVIEERVAPSFDAVFLKLAEQERENLEQKIIAGDEMPARLLRDNSIKVHVFEGERDATEVLKDRVGTLAFSTVEPHTEKIGSSRVIVATHTEQKDPSKFAGGRDDFYIVTKSRKTILLEYSTKSLDGRADLDGVIRWVIARL